MKTFFITGTASGFGELMASRALRLGHNVVATARTPSNIKLPPSERLLVLEADVTSPRTIAQAFKTAVERFGQVDVVIGNAAQLVVGELEAVSDDLAHQIFETNFFGSINVLRVALPLFRKQGSGTVLFMASKAGIRGSPLTSLYSSTKFALQGLVESILLEIDPKWNINLLLAELGGFKTGAHGRSGAEPTIPAYEHLQRNQAIRQLLGSDDPRIAPGDPGWGAKLCVDYALMDSPPKRLIIGEDAYNEIHVKLEGLKAEYESWKDVSLGKRDI